MAVVKGNVWGHLTGRVGNFSTRITSGRTILAARPVSFNVPNTPSALQRRGRFGAAIKLASMANHLPDIKEIWEQVKTSVASGCNKCTQENYLRSSNTGLTQQNIITPVTGLVVNIQNLANDGLKITANIPALNSIIGVQPEEVHCSFNAVVCFNTPLAVNDIPYQLTTLSKVVPNYDFAEIYNLQMDFNVQQQAVAARYDSSIVYLAFALRSADDRVLRFSTTVSAAF